jgi:Flp pilus assembly protein TadG
MVAGKQQKGQALVETSLVIITLLLMLIGIMDFGQFLFYQQALTDRARVGARYAVTNTCCSSSDITAIKNMVVSNDPTGNSSTLFGLQPSYVSVTPTPAAGVPAQVKVTISTCYNCTSGGSEFPLNLFFTKAGTYHSQIIAVRQAEGLGAVN